MAQVIVSFLRVVVAIEKEQVLTDFDVDVVIVYKQDKGRPLPKFGEWDVTNPASAEGYTVIFSKARDDKKTNGAGGVGSVSQNNTSKQHNSDYPPTKKRFCCF